MKRLFSIVLLVIALFFLAEVAMPKAMVTFYPVYKEIASNHMIKNLEDYEIYTSAHFQIYHRHDENVKKIAKEAERSYRFVINDMNYKPEGKICLLVFPDYESMDSFMGLKGENAEGTYREGILGVLSPMVTAGLDPGVIPHELTHLVVDDIAKGNYPIWFTEGVALLEEYRINGFIWGEGMSGGDGRYTVKQLTESFDELDTNTAYKRSLEIVKGISDKKGFDSILKVMEQLGKGEDLDSAFAGIGMEINSLNDL